MVVPPPSSSLLFAPASKLLCELRQMAFTSPPLYTPVSSHSTESFVAVVVNAFFPFFPSRKLNAIIKTRRQTLDEKNLQWELRPPSVSGCRHVFFSRSGTKVKNCIFFLCVWFFIFTSLKFFFLFFFFSLFLLFIIFPSDGHKVYVSPSSLSNSAQY